MKVLSQSVRSCSRTWGAPQVKDPNVPRFALETEEIFVGIRLSGQKRDVPVLEPTDEGEPPGPKGQDMLGPLQHGGVDAEREFVRSQLNRPLEIGPNELGPRLGMGEVGLQQSEERGGGPAKKPTKVRQAAKPELN